MPATAKSTINMVENTISSLKNCEQFEEKGIKQGYYLKGEKEQLYMLFGQNKIDLFNNGNHFKSYQVNVAKDMKEAMNEASVIIKDIKSTLNEIDQKAITKEKGLDFNSLSKGNNKTLDKGMEL